MIFNFKQYLISKIGNNVIINKILSYFGYKMQMIGFDFHDIPEKSKQIYKIVKPYTMTGENNVYTMCSLVDYIEKRNITGDIVECGVWKGGMMMTALLSLNDSRRHIYLYDTFQGMSIPSESDGVYANNYYTNTLLKDGTSDWCRGELSDVMRNIERCNYDSKKIHYVKGKVEDTIPKTLPNKDIAILRLDTDWYESTKHELIHLYPLVVKGGIVIIDDYGAWQGSKKAVDEYFKENNLTYYLHRIDNSARYFIKY